MGGLDLLITGGRILDGTGSPAYEGDVGVRAGRVVVLPAGADATAAETIDARDLLVTPGFVDVHTHSDLLGGDDAERDALRAAPLLQGVTTELCGNCGISAFPSTPARLDELTELVVTTFGRPARAYPTMTEYVAAQTAPRRTNLATLVGHGALRAGVLGLADRAATPNELSLMERLLDDALGAGAVGFSTGLIYPPGVYADTGEVVALARVAARHGKPYVTHLRDEMSRVEQALEESLDIAHASGAALQVSHHKTAGRSSWGATVTTLKRLTKARDDGLDVACDVYPYTAGSTTLHAMLPPWTAAGGIAEMLERIGDPAVRERIRADIASGLPGWENTVGSNGGWHRIDVASAPRTPAYEGDSIADLAAASGLDPVDLVCDLLRDNAGTVTIISRSMHEDDVRRVIASPLSMIASDGVPTPGRLHPRWAGSFARVLGRYVRHERLIPIETAVHKMTGMPAGRFGLRDRGTVADGAVADLVVLDPAAVRDTATYDDPLAPPRGVRAVVVDGRVVVDDGTVREATPGRLLTVP